VLVYKKTLAAEDEAFGGIESRLSGRPLDSPRQMWDK
jgi:hypothetical protein